jgi:hypothetical protein
MFGGWFPLDPPVGLDAWLALVARWAAAEVWCELDEVCEAFERPPGADPRAGGSEGAGCGGTFVGVVGRVAGGVVVVVVWGTVVVVVEGTVVVVVVEAGTVLVLVEGVVVVVSAGGVVSCCS